MGFLQEMANVLTKGVLAVKPQPFDTGWFQLQGHTTSIYAADDVVGLALVMPVPKSGTIETVLFNDEDKEELATNLICFNEAPTIVDDHDIFVVGVGDYEKQEGDIAITNADFSTYSASSLATVNNLGMRFDAPRGTLIVYVQTSGTPTIAAQKQWAFRFKGYATS